MPGTRLYDIWMAVAMLILVIGVVIGVGSFVIENAFHDGVSMCPVYGRVGTPPEMKPCYLTITERIEP